MEELSLLHPQGIDPEYRKLPEETIHDLALEELCAALSTQEPERALLRRIMISISGKPEVIAYRCDVFEDILRFPGMRERLQKLLDRVDFLKTYRSFMKDSDASGIWELMHRLDEMDEYIECVQAIYTCLNENEIRSDGLLALKEYVKRLYEDNGYEALKKDVDALKVRTSEIRSVTLGVNLNERFEPNAIGIVSINSKYFTKSGILSNFCDFLNMGDELQKDTQWKKNYSFRPARDDEKLIGKMDRGAARLGAARQAAVTPGLVNPAADGSAADVIHTLDRAASAMLSGTVKKLREILSRHVVVSMHAISGLIPEVLYYVRWAEYIEGLRAEGYVFCRPQLLSPQERRMSAKGFYNPRLIHNSPEIIPNDLDFDARRRIYILTGANRGGKTTVTQAVGMMFLLAQSGVYVPAEFFAFSPADMIFTHFPADENKTMDLGRLGEEARRFQNIFSAAGPRSLFLLNESFSTTSFEEGFTIARDVVRALMKLGARTIFNTHMHKLAFEIDTLNQEMDTESKTASLVAETEDGQRSYRMRVGTPQGRSYAYDIAQKYGVTYEQLLQSSTHKDAIKG